MRVPAVKEQAAASPTALGLTAAAIAYAVRDQFRVS